MPSDRLFVFPFLHFARWIICTARKIISYKIGAQLSRAGKTVGAVACGGATGWRRWWIKARLFRQTRSASRL